MYYENLVKIDQIIPFLEATNLPHETTVKVDLRVMERRPSAIAYVKELA